MSYYKGPINNKRPHANTTPGQLHQVITRPPRYLRERAAATRAAFAAHGKKHPAYVALKTQLDYFTAAGTFPPGHRQAADILTRSGLLILDFDDLPDVAAARAALLADAWAAPDLVLLFVSPAGNGLKALVQTDPTAAHLDNFRAWADYLGRTYAALGLAPDEAGKDVCRACFLSRDPDAWLAPAYAA